MGLVLHSFSECLTSVNVEEELTNRSCSTKLPAQGQTELPAFEQTEGAGLL